MENTVENNPAAQNNPSEFAKKQPLINPKTMALAKKIAIGAGAFFVLFIIVTIIYKSIPKQQPIASIDTNTEDEAQIVSQEERRYFAYIKDTKAIWIADTKGENKQMVLEIPASSTAVFSTLTWKSPSDLTYVMCEDTEQNNCNIRTINIESKAITDEYASENMIKKMIWDKTSAYIGFIETTLDGREGIRTNFKLKTGTIVNELNTFLKQDDPGNTKVQVMFSSDNKYIVYYSVMRKITKISDTQSVEIIPLIEVYLLNGTKVDQIESATDPFFITENKLGYIKNNSIIYKTVGLEDETIATAFNGSNPSISPDKNLIAYWYSEGNLNNVVLGVFDTNLNIHRNLLRGIVLPIWISDSEILGIKADNCLQGTTCQLYQFQTNSISLVDIQRGNVVQVDQGKRISEPSFVFFEDKNAD